MIEKQDYGTCKGEPISLYVLSNAKITLGVITLGGGIQFLRIRTDGGERDAVLSFPVEERLSNGTYCGATIGRTCNRIRKGKFSLHGQEYALTVNDGKNHLHGGTDGFDRRIFTAEVQGETLLLRLFSEDGDQGYPGNLQLNVRYSLLPYGVRIDYEGKCDRDTLWCPTNHAYFDLTADRRGIRDTELYIDACYFTPIDAEIMATGEVRSVQGTPFDFTVPKKIGEGLSQRDGQIALANGYDHNFLLNGREGVKVVADGLQMTVCSDMPCLQFYSGNYLEGRYPQYGGMALEPQYCPNAVNMQGFAVPVLKKGEVRTQYIEYRFAEKQ